MEPALTRLDAAGRSGALVLMLHGGKAQSSALVDGRSASWRRSLWMQRDIAPSLHEAGMSVWLLRYRRRGWNAAGRDVVADARWALDEVRASLGDVPVVLLGHSMGARVAVHVADDPQVRGVVGLAPWWQPGDPVATLRGRHLVAAHGRRDRVTSFRATAAYVDRARAVAASADFRDMGRLGHYMLSGVAAWNETAVAATRQVMVRATQAG